jgi:hypothetical protein
MYAYRNNSRAFLLLFALYLKLVNASLLCYFVKSLKQLSWTSADQISSKVIELGEVEVLVPLLINYPSRLAGNG